MRIFAKSDCILCAKMLKAFVYFVAIAVAAFSHCSADEDFLNYTGTISKTYEASGIVATGFDINPMELYDPDYSDICPPGSELVHGICKCNQDLCEPPPCDKFLKIVRNGTDNPTSCCPTYTCDNCTSETVENGTCSCGEEAFLNEKGVCECIDFHKSFEDNTCVCDPRKCELPIICGNDSVPIKEKDGCCIKTTCKKCPDDTYATNYSSNEIEDKCVCFPCPETRCNETHVPLIVRRGTNLATQCCDLYKCVPRNTVCHVDNVTYTDGERWITKGNQNCSCGSGVTLCDEPVLSVKKSCLYNNVAYPHLASWTMDTCTNCTCDDGYQKCIAHLCNITETRITKYNECLYQDQSYQHLETWQTKNCENCTCYNGTPKCELYMCDTAPIDMKKPNICPSLEKCKRYCKYGFKNRKGCEICKCKLPEKAVDNSPLDIYMRNHNLSEIDVLDLLNEKAPNEQCKGVWYYLIGVTALVVALIAVVYYSILIYKKKCCNRYSPVLKHSENNNVLMEGGIKYRSEKKPLKT